MNGKSVQEFIKSYTRFDLTDPFGVNRIRKLAYEYKMQEFEHAGEVEYLHAIRDEQAKAISLLINKLNSLDPDALTRPREIELETELRKKSDLMDALQAYAEHLEEDLAKERKTNQALQFQVDSAHALIETLKHGLKIQEIEVRDDAASA